MRILRRLIGARNYVGPTMHALGLQFGAAPLIGKSLAVIADARKPSRDPQLIVERLLTMSGEDAVTVHRKHRDPWTGQLPVRFIVLSNEVPSFADASGALSSRFVVLVQVESWLGREDRPGEQARR